MGIRIEAGFTGLTYPMTNPRVCSSPIVGGTPTASTQATGFEAVNANDDLTWTFWKPTAMPATWDMTFGVQNISYCAIAAHNFGSVLTGVQLQEWDGAAWVNIFNAQTPTDDDPLVFLFAQRNTDRLRLRFTNAIPTVGVIWIGSVIEFPQKCVWTGGVPFNEATESVFTDAISDGGHVLERFSTRKASSCQMTINNLSESWAASVLPVLKTHMANRPIFMADRPSAYPKSVTFGSQAEPLRAERTKNVLGAARTVQFNIVGNAP